MFLPVFSFLTSVFFVSIALHHTTRLWSLPCILLSSYTSLITANELHDIADLWAIGLVVYVVHVTSLLFIEKWVLPRPSPDKRYDFLAAYKLWSNPQFLKTARQVPGAHTVDPDHGHPPSRTRFTIVRVARITVYLALMQLWTSYIFPGPFLPLTADDFSPTKEIYLRRLLSPSPENPITVRETAIRSLSAIHWIWTAYLTLDCAHDALGIFFTVILRLDNTIDWQNPLFGSPCKTYTLRGFWGRFWHRLVYRAYTNYGRCVGQRVLRLRPGSVAERWCCIFMVFGISGCSHALVMQGVWGSSGWREVSFFVLNFVAGAVESAAVKVVKGRVRGNRVLGYLWVFGFFFWCVPKREYPNIHALLSTLD